MEEDNRVSVDKGKGVLVPYYSDDEIFLFKKSKTREEDDVKLLELLNTHFYNNHASVVSKNEYTYIQRETGERVDTDRIIHRMSELQNNYMTCVDANGVIKPFAITIEKLYGRFSSKVFELSQLYWGPKIWDSSIMDDHLFDESQSVKEDIITLLKHLRNYLSTNGGGFNRFKKLNVGAFQDFMSFETKKTISATRLEQKMSIVEKHYCEIVKPGEIENRYIILDPQDKEYIDLLRVIGIHHRPF